MWNHVSRYHNESDLELYGLLKPGETARHAIQKYNRGDLMKYKTSSFDDKYRRLEPNKPSYTIVAHLRKDGNSFIHPFQVRIFLFVRLLAAVLPRRLYFHWVERGSVRADRERCSPLMAEAIARTFITVLKERRG